MEEEVTPRKRLYIHQHHPHTHQNVNDVQYETLTLGDRVADAVAAGMGSWRFIIIQSMIVLAWIGSNLWILSRHPFDPYPFILLNLLFSTQAAYAAPIIMKSQNRQADKDRLMAEETYKAAIKEEHQTQEIVRHLSAQDEEMLKQQAELLKQTPMLQEIREMLKQQQGRGGKK